MGSVVGLRKLGVPFAAPPRLRLIFSTTPIETIPCRRHSFLRKRLGIQLVDVRDEDA